MIRSIGESSHVHVGLYDRYIFGTYRFISIDARGNNIYHANIQGMDWFIVKDVENYWVVRITIL